MQVLVLPAFTQRVQIFNITLRYYYEAVFSVTCIFQTERFVYDYLNMERTMMYRIKPLSTRFLQSENTKKQQMY
jgi:NAD-dependent SIR2 family protein deacetylase